MGDWTESKYTETRFGGMDRSVEPHTLDRDGGVMADEFNMQSRTQGLRTRKGWRLANDLSLYVSSLPGKPKSPLALIGYEANLATVAEDDGNDGDSGGDGGNGGVIGGLIDGGGDDDVTPGGGGAGVSLTFTGPQTVVAEVPFAIASGASSHYAGGNAHLDWAFQPDGQPSVSLSKGIRSGWSDNAWSATATILTADRSRTGVTATLRKGGSVQATKNMGYSVASMIPSLTSPVPYRQQFTFTISCKLGSATQTYYEGNGRGVSISWQALDGSDHAVFCHVRCNLVEWSNGAGTYHGYLSSAEATAVKLKVTATYAGESKSAEASFSGVGILRVPSSLHVFADGGTMRINAVGLTPSSLSIVAKVGGETVDVSDYLEMDDGASVDFSHGWDGDIWEHGIRAKSSAPAVTLTLKLMDGETELASETINITDTLAAAIDTDESVKPGEDIEATATISATGFALTRIPGDTVELQILDGDGTIQAYMGNEANTTELSTALEGASSGRYTVQVVRGGTVLATAEVTVEHMKSMLAAAINERMLANNGTSGAYSDEDSASTLHDAAISAITGYAKGAIAADGTFTAFTSSNHDIPAAADTDEWYAAAYAIVKTAVSKTAVPSQQYYSQYWKKKYKSVTTQGELTRDANDDVIGVEDLSSLISRALSNWEAAIWNEDYDGEMKCRKEMLVTEPSYTNKNTYTRGSVTVNVALYYMQTPYRLYVDGVIDFYMSASPYVNGGNYDNCGHHLPSSANVVQKTYSLNASAGVEVLTDKLAGENVTMNNIYSGSYQTIYGYNASTNAAIATYNFTHK